MRRSLIYALSMGLAFSSANTSWSTLATETAADVAAAIRAVSSTYKYLATDGIRISDIAASSSTELDNASIGTVSITPSTGVYWVLDASNNLRAFSPVGSAWRTFKAASLASSWNSTTTITLTEDVRDGVSNPGSPYTLSLILTKTGTVADLTRAVLSSFLGRASTTSLAGSASGTSLTSTSALSTGWTARAYVADGSAAATAATLDPVALTVGMTVTPLGGTALSFSSSMSDLYSWNVAAGIPAPQDVLFTASGGRYIKFTAYPDLFARTSGIATTLISTLNSMPTRINQSTKSYLNSISSCTSDVLGIMDASAPASAKIGLNALAKAAVASSNFAIGDFTTTADTSKLGAVALASGNITSVTWRTSGSTLIANGKIGSGALKDFSCSLSGMNAVNSSTNPVLEFASDDGDSFWVKCVDATGYDLSADNTVEVADRDDLLALQLKSKLSGVVTIAAAKLKALIVASQS